MTNATHSVTMCDDNLDGSKIIDLLPFISQFTTDPAVTPTFYATQLDAQNNNAPLVNPINITGVQTIYVRFEKPGICPNIASITINVKTPKHSDILVSKVICPQTKTILDAGPGFTSYLWSNGATTPSISNVGPGNYWVDLTFDGCTYRQNVTVTESVLPVINTIEINGSTVTIGVSGGTPPYEYSLDGINWQTSNVFTNVPRGNQIAHVRDSNRCDEVIRTFVMINLINTITPNLDGYNDSIDYSALMDKDNIIFRIFDRYGAEIFRGDRSNRFIWDGKIQGGRPINTATYWYFLSWTESKGATTVKYTSWLLVKNY